MRLPHFHPLSRDPPLRLFRQFSNFDGVNDSCMVRSSSRRKSANEVRGDIVLGATRANCVAKYTSADFPGSMRGMDDSFRFDFLQDSQ
jgi:hypothetical protein